MRDCQPSPRPARPPRSSRSSSGLGCRLTSSPGPLLQPPAQASCELRGGGQAAHISLWQRPGESRCSARPPSTNSQDLPLEPRPRPPGMEAAAGSTWKGEEASPAGAEGHPASPQQEPGSPLPQLLSPVEEHPKIWLPRTLRQTYIRKVGDTVNLLIPFQGKPKPRATWTHDGYALDASRVSVWNGEQDSILFFREAQRADSGRYQLSVQLGELEATATIDILVIERPGPPQSIKLVDVWGSNATLEWTPPQDTGNAALLGYTVQKADTKSGLWFTVLEHYHCTSFTVSDLIVGNSYSFRVFAENQCGLSETAPITADLAHIQKAATISKTEGFAQRDFSEAPKFTQPLADCTTITGYDTQLFCCVRASPKPKIIWLKNKMDIQGNPKYRALSHLGICSLEIRKPGPFDGGIYTCKAVNPLGEASVDCRVDVKAPH